MLAGRMHLANAADGEVLEAPVWGANKEPFEQVQLQLTRDPRPLPKLVLNPEVKSIFDFKIEDMTIINYDPHPHIKGAVAV